MPSASPAVIELFRNVLRVIVFIGLIDWLRADATTATEIQHFEISGPQGWTILRCDDAVEARINGHFTCRRDRACLTVVSMDSAIRLTLLGESRCSQIRITFQPRRRNAR